MLSHDSEIIIVGGGIFGLSSALWLARGGYRNITIFDRCAFDKNWYNPSRGCDGASADINKVFRMAYAERTDYQDLAIEARDFWLSWNKAIADAGPTELPEGLTPEDKLLYTCGSYFLAEGPELRDYYADSLKTMERTAPEFRNMQFVKGNADDEKRLGEIDPKWVEKYHIVDKINGGNTNGFIDIQGGITIADKACVYAKFLCEQAGVNFVLGDPQGKFSSLIIENDGVHKRVAGIKTCDGLRHFGDLVVVAAGSWTASIIPEAHQTVEATAGTVMFIDIPNHRQDLWKRFHADNYPVWSYRRGDGEDYYQGGGFPISKEGRLKFGFRGRKFTNFQPHPTHPDLRISTPRTRYTADRINTVPLYGLSRMKEVITQAFPELAEFNFTDSRLCWYTDSIDNDYVIDYVPGYSDSLFICTGGSGHAFKFLPVLGKHVKNQLERLPDQFTSAWKWRVAEQGKPNNGLSEGEDGPREMSKLEMASGKFQTLI
ncbi:FAD dependent oxidoreductase [Dactylonectria estremocensis]|uniref:FAD dependent oxidoreductase n=1 Tax=Dactylonectria estremocensis TaxID=1079267 RepID=A0A9P9E549_9HYPO|nr:FAD dependent oxidoreductase [Dactylonectria estremocensis]